MIHSSIQKKDINTNFQSITIGWSKKITSLKSRLVGDVAGPGETGFAAFQHFFYDVVTSWQQNISHVIKLYTHDYDKIGYSFSKKCANCAIMPTAIENSVLSDDFFIANCAKVSTVSTTSTTSTLAH